jgi:hypothetical protein
MSNTEKWEVAKVIIATLSLIGLILFHFFV